MPDKKTTTRAHKDKKQGKAASTQAGEYVREEMDHIREGKHGAKNAKQAIAIGLSKARRAGVKLKSPKKGTTSEATRKKAKQDSAKARKTGGKSTSKSKTRSTATTKALKKQPRAAASKTALSRHAKSASRQQTAAERSASAKKGARTRAKNKAK